MEPADLARSAGTRLKELRLRVGLTLRDVEARSLKLAKRKKAVTISSLAAGSTTSRTGPTRRAFTSFTA